MKKLIIKKLSVDEKTESLRFYASLSEDQQATLGTPEEYLNNNSNQTFLAVQGIKDSQPWQIDQDAIDMLELLEKLKNCKDDFIILDDKYIKVLLKKKATAKTPGKHLQLVIDVVKSFENAVEFDPAKTADTEA